MPKFNVFIKSVFGRRGWPHQGILDMVSILHNPTTNHSHSVTLGYCSDIFYLTTFKNLDDRLLLIFLARLTTNPGATSSVNPVEVVKAETLTISEIAAFIKREPAKVIPIWLLKSNIFWIKLLITFGMWFQVAYFDCIATIDDVKLGTEWYYIACKDCQTKLNRGPTTLLCPKCGNENATAVAK